MKYLLILILALTSNIVSKRSKEDLKCIKANKWQNAVSSTKTISSSSVCTSISTSCCYINMTYTYINFNLSSQYCASLSGNLENFKTYLDNLYNDDLYFFSNYTYRNKDKYKNIGRQLDTDFSSNYKCNKAPLKTSYSTYLYNNCGKFDSNGACLFEKDTYYFGNFTRSFYRNFTAEFCNKEVKGTCLLYNGTQSNNAIVRPLLLDLIDYLHIDEPNYVFNQEDDIIDIDVDTEDKIKERWTINCSDIPKIDFEIICPDKYVSGYFTSLTVKLVFICILVLV